MPEQKTDPRLTTTTLKVLGVLFESPADEFSGREIGQKAKLPSGTVYPILIRLAQAGWLSNRWEEISPHEAGRPRRRYYKITGLGFEKTRLALQDLDQRFGLLSWT